MAIGYAVPVNDDAPSPAPRLSRDGISEAGRLAKVTAKSGTSGEAGSSKEVDIHRKLTLLVLGVSMNRNLEIALRNW